MQSPTQPIDAGAPITFAVADDEHSLYVEPCAHPLCKCDNAVLSLISSGGGAADELRFDLQVSTRVVVARTDEPAATPSPERVTWLSEILHGEVGDRVVTWVARCRAQADRRSWQRLDWAQLEDAAFVANDVMFPHDWVLATVGDGRWVRDLYCVRDGCDCSDVRLEVRDERGLLGAATMRLASRREPKVVACDPAVQDVIDDVCDARSMCDRLERRHREARAVARMRRTWVVDCADPARVAARLAAGTGELKLADRDVAYYLGDRIVEPLVRIARNDAAPAARRVRALRLLSAIGESSIAEPLLEALDSAWLPRVAGGQVFEDLLGAFVELRSAARAAVLARVGPDSHGAVVRAATLLGIDDPRVWAALARYLEREPIEALGLITPETPDGAALAHAALMRALDAQPPDVDVAGTAIETLDAVDAEVPEALRARVEQLEESALAPKPQAPSWITQLGSSSTPPPGRNRPCPCGSGKKAKVCCARD